MKFTIVMTVFRRPELIPHALFTIVHQLYPHWELIVVADGPDPEAERIVRNYMAMEPTIASRIFYMTVDHVQGLWGNRARRAGLERASGVYTAFVGHDCLILPDYLAAHMENIEATAPQPIVSSVDVTCWVMRCPVKERAAQPNWISTRPVYIGKLPRVELDLSIIGDLDLIGLAVPTKLAIEYGVFGTQVEREYAGDWYAFRDLYKVIPYRHRPGIVAGHF